MDDSRRPASPQPRSRQSASLLPPLGLYLAALFVAWTVCVYVVRNSGGIWPVVPQVLPLLLWSIAILGWLAWQRISKPARWLGFLPVSGLRIGAAVAAFLLAFAWNYIRVSLARPPGEMLGLLPPQIYLWLVLGVLLNEVLLRGVVLSRLCEAVDPAIAIAATAVIGVIFRIPALFAAPVPAPFDAMMLFGIFIFGCIAGLLRHYTKSLWPAIALQWGNALGALL